jgi:hypothetical protein
MVGPNRPFADQFPNHVIYALQFFHRWHIGSYTRSWAGCPDCIVVSGLPPDGEVFLLTSPFIDRYLVSEFMHRGYDAQCTVSRLYGH